MQWELDECELLQIAQDKEHTTTGVSKMAYEKECANKWIQLERACPMC